MEQVPTSLKYILEHPILNSTGVHIYPAVFGYEFGAPTLRKRLYVGGGWTFEGTWKHGEPRPKRAAHTISVDEAFPEMAMALKREPRAVAIRGAKNYIYTDAKRDGTGPNRKVRSEEGEGLRDLCKTTYALMASQILTVWVLDEKTKRWSKARDLTMPEAYRIQGFPAGFNNDFKEHALEWYETLDSTEKHVKTVKMCKGHFIRGVGNSVCPAIARAIFE